jgi:hypothetical protein
MDAKGDREWTAVIALLRSSLRAAAERYGARVTQRLRDGAMVSGVEAVPVALCACEVRDLLARESPLPSRVRPAHGPVIMFEGDDYIGAAVKTAARLVSAASPNQLLATAAFGQVVEPRIRSVWVAERRVRGLAERVPTAELGQSRRLTPSFAPPSARGATGSQGHECSVVMKLSCGHCRRVRSSVRAIAAQDRCRCSSRDRRTPRQPQRWALSAVGLAAARRERVLIAHRDDLAARAQALPSQPKLWRARDPHSSERQHLSDGTWFSIPLARAVSERRGA